MTQTYHLTIMWGTSRWDSYGSNKNFTDEVEARKAYDVAVADPINTFVKLECTSYELLEEFKR